MAPLSLPSYHSKASRLDQHARIHNALRIERTLGGAKSCREQVRSLPIVPSTMVASDRVMMRDRAPGRDQCIARGILDRLPLFEQRAVPTKRVEGEIRRGSVGIDMGETTGDFAFHAGRIKYGA